MADARGQVQAAMGQLIAARLALMVDDCSVTRPETVEQTPVLDEAGDVTNPPDPEVYAGPCVFADPSVARQAGQTLTDSSGVPTAPVLRVPHTADLRPGDVVTCTASLVSPALVGDVFVVLGEQERTFASYRRYTLRGSSWESATTGG